MTSYSKQQLTAMANELGFIRDTFEKMFRLVGILKIIENDPLLSSGLALKGGTAINLTIFNLPRLSVDIDLDYAHDISIDDMMNERDVITDVIKRYMVAEGYELSDKSKRHHSLDSFIFAFTNSAGIKDYIKIEINYSMRCHILPLERRSAKIIDALDTVSVLSVAPLEIFSSKVAALLARTAARDLYDINNMVISGLFKKSEEVLLRKCVVFYYAISGKVPFIISDISSINRLTSRKIRTDLQPVLRKRDWFDLPAAQKRVKDYLAHLLKLSSDEENFLKLFHQSEYRPELLFTGDILERIKNHQMAIWKTK